MESPLIPRTMRALVKAKAEPGIWMQEMPIPEYGPEDVLIKVCKTGICGTDIHIYHWDEWAQATIPVPMIIGHEFFGEIVALGANVKNLIIGQKVSGEGHITCGHCKNCRAGQCFLCKNVQGTGVNRPGCFGEYMVMPAFNVVPLPDKIQDSHAAIMDPFGNAMHCALSFPVAGEDVLITGAGPVGIMTAAIARHAGARSVVITDINDYRLDLALKMGATKAINVSHQALEKALDKQNMTEGFTRGFEISGNAQAFNALIAAMNPGGKVVLVGILSQPTAIDWTQVIFKGLTLKGIYGREMFGTWQKMIAMLESGLNLNPVITHHFPAEEYRNAFETMASGQSGKVILDW